MRLWSKLIVMIVFTIGVQAAVEREAGWLDETWFAVRVGVHGLLPGADPQDPEIMAAARELWTRSEDRAVRVAAAGGGAGGPYIIVR